MPIATVAGPATTNSPMVGLALLVASAALVAFFLRRLRVPAASLVGGTVVGFMLGSAFFGRIAPEAYLRLFEGPPDVLRQSIASDRAIGALAFAAKASGAAADAGDIERLSAERDRDRAAWNQARADHRVPFSVAAFVCAAITLATSFARGARPRRPGAPEFVIALWSMALPAACVALFARVRGDDVFSPATALTVAACACGAWRVAREERAIARAGATGTARAAATVAAIATIVMSLIAAVGLFAALDATTAALAAAALLGCAALSLAGRSRWIAGAVAWCVIPSLAALVAIGVDPVRDLSPILFVFLFLIAEDGRWLGAFAARAIGGEPAGVSLRTALAGLAAGPTMLAFTAAGAATRILSPATTAGLLLAAVLLEFLAPARLRVARRLEDAQAELDDTARR